jgi:glutathione S-transferase
MQALCDGILDASILTVYEGRWRAPEHHERKWLEHQAGKVTRALGVLNDAPPKHGGLPHVGQIALACALGYRDLRFSTAWRADYPRLAAWLEDFAARVPSFAATAIKP